MAKKTINVVDVTADGNSNIVMISPWKKEDL